MEAHAHTARQLAAQLKSFAYQSLVVEHPTQIPVPLPGQVGPAAIVAATTFCGDPVLTQHADTTAPLIFISGSNDFADRLKAVQAGASAYCPAPLDINALAGLLDRVTSAEPARPYRILIVDDDEALAAFLQVCCKRGACKPAPSRTRAR
ncbi:hypothetical protein [Polaromonas sp.]|uniref:hypothetical protein n=1 Tax=Polaromonas sp. TaxID=1869339 RepID=UPI003563F6C2